jgi:transaldolase
MKSFNGLKVKLFADGADLAGIQQMAKNTHIAGFTTNPTLMRKAGVTNYEEFALEVLKIVQDRPVSFEVFADDFELMEKQAEVIASWGSNVNVKIPITNTKGAFCGPTVKRLTERGVAVNVTAIMTAEQVKRIAEYIAPQTPVFVSVFAGRIADTGRDPIQIMSESLHLIRHLPKAEIIWASPRELLNIFHSYIKFNKNYKLIVQNLSQPIIKVSLNNYII